MRASVVLHGIARRCVLLVLAVSLARIGHGEDAFGDAGRNIPIDVQVSNTEHRAGVEILDVTFSNLTGSRTKAYLVVPPGKGPFAGILYVHWYEPPNPTSNRTEYVNEAVEMAKHGAVSLLPATMWSAFDWFPKRKREDDLKSSLQQLRELRRAMDVLLAQPGVDKKRVAYVGHDFGAMFGAV